MYVLKQNKFSQKRRAFAVHNLVAIRYSGADYKILNSTTYLLKQKQRTVLQ